MPLSSGTRLGPYQITGLLGAGGMGEVYRAMDTRLHRTVAIKVLPELFAVDPSFRTRFDREARAISALNHPHICTLHDIGREGTIAYLVMEHVDGGPIAGPVPVARAIAIATQICDALEAAHRAGIVHRDLKPSNILVSTSNPPIVKLLDFGLAQRTDGSGRAPDATVTTITGPHTVVGTPQYMAPEQIEGRGVDARTDIFSLGCVLYELVTGKRAFAGDSPSSAMASILATEPRPLRELLPVTPPLLDWIVMRCLAKNPDDRWQTVRDLRAALERVAHASADAPPARSAPARTAWIVAAVAGLAAIAGFVWAVSSRHSAPSRDTRIFMSEFVAPTAPTGPPALRFSLSPDGTRLAYTALDATGKVMLWVRALDSLSSQPLAGTTNATAPFWSADGRAIAFIADGKLKRIDASGGPVATICNATTAPPGAWNADDVILFTGPTSVIARVAARGGTPTPLLKRDDTLGPRLHIAPVFLPDGRHFIYASTVPGAGVRGIYLASLDSPDSTLLLPNVASNATYSDGYLLFLRDATLVAQPFDPSTLTVSGEPMPLAEQIQTNPTTGTGAFSVSRAGVLVYQTSIGGGGTTLSWFDRRGTSLGPLGGNGGYLDVQLSHDARHASVSRPAEGGGPTDVWIYDIARKLPTRFTFGPERTGSAIWSFDDKHLVYSVQRDPGSVIMIKPANGAGAAELLIEDRSHNVLPLSMSPDGRFLLYNEVTRAMLGKMMVLPLTGERKPYPYLSSGHSEIPVQFSPDGKWLAYVSDQSDDRKEVYVTAFPKPGGLVQISTSGGDFPRWRGDGKEIFFLAPNKMMSASLAIDGEQIKVEDVKPLFDVRWPSVARSVYDVTPDGEKFLMNVWGEGASLPMAVVVNWKEKLRR